MKRDSFLEERIDFKNLSDSDAWLSLVERCVRDAEVAGSNPVASTVSNEWEMPRHLLFLCRKGKNEKRKF